MSRLRKRFGILSLFLVLAAGCQTAGTAPLDHCLIDEPLTVDSRVDQLSDETAQLIEVHNIIYERICGK